MSVSVLIPNACETTGEGPFWDDVSKTLLYVDINNGSVHLWSSLTGQDAVHKFENTLSFVIPRKAGGYVISLGRTIATLDWDSAKTETLCEIEHGTKNRFNDGKCDASGRLWAGTMGYESAPGCLDRQQGALYSLDEKHAVRQHVDKIDISNGMGWSADNRVMYYVDTLPRKVYAFDFDMTNGSLSNQRICIDFDAHGTVDAIGLPDGMCVDSEGKLWVACYAGGKVISFDPQTGAKLRTIEFPVKKITSCCFGGSNFDELYVTSGKWIMSDEEFRTNQPLAGSVFKVTGLGVHGFAAPSYNG